MGVSDTAEFRHHVVVGLRSALARHPSVGEVTVDCDSLALTERDQHLLLCTARPGSRGAEALALLNVVGTESFSGGTR